MLTAALWATVLAGEGASTSSTIPVTTSSTLPVAIIGGVSLIVVALIPELFRWLRRNAPEIVPTSVVTPAALDAAEARISAALELRASQALERANAARAEVRALRRAMEARDESHREDLQALRDELNRHLWTTQDNPEPVPPPREPTG